MWVQLDSWKVEDQLLTLRCGDQWQTALEVDLGGAEVEPTATIDLQLAEDPFSLAGPCYDIVARVRSNETHGPYLDAGSVTLTPSAYKEWPVDTIVRFRSLLGGGWYPTTPVPDHLLFQGQVQNVVFRCWEAESDDQPNTYRPDRSSLQTGSVDRLPIDEHGMERPSGPRTFSDYLVELVDGYP